MKKILAYLMVGIAFTGCNSLDLEPISSIADNKYWQTEAQVDAFNVGLHSKFREKCSYSIFLFGEPRADYYFGESTFGSATQGNERMWNNSLNDVNTVVSNFGNLYEVINQANLMINKVEGMSMNESTKKYYLGEVYGIRAFLYFQLLRSYGDVVIWTDFSEGSSLDLGNLARPASSAADVMKLIVDDLQASETAFGDNYGFRNDSQRYFWSKAATMMLKGEVYMWRGKHMGGGNEDYTTAKNALQEVRNQTDKFGLLEDFSEVFSYDNKNNKEIIFAIRNARDEYNMWGEHSGAGVYVKLKPSDWYLFYEEGLAIEYDFSIDCLDSDGNKVKYECNSGVTTEYSKPSGWGYKQSDRNSAVFKFGRAKGSLIFINKKAIKNMNFRYDNSIKRNRVYECTLSKDLDEYEFKGIKLKDMAEAGLGGTINHGFILQSFE